MAKKANPTKPSKPSGSGKSSGSQSYFLLLLGMLSVGAMWFYGTGLLFGIWGIRYSIKNSKAASGDVGRIGKWLSVVGTIICIIYLIAFAIKTIA
jgi:hypothetical protein